MNDGVHHSNAVNPNKEVATDTKSAFDIFSIDKERRKINIIRIGAGENRELVH